MPQKVTRMMKVPGVKAEEDLGGFSTKVETESCGTNSQIVSGLLEEGSHWTSSLLLEEAIADPLVDSEERQLFAEYRNIFLV